MTEADKGNMTMDRPVHTPGPWQFRFYASSDEDVAWARKHGIAPVRS